MCFGKAFSPTAPPPSNAYSMHIGIDEWRREIHKRDEKNLLFYKIYKDEVIFEFEFVLIIYNKTSHNEIMCIEEI